MFACIQGLIQANLGVAVDKGGSHGQWALKDLIWNFSGVSVGIGLGCKLSKTAHFWH